MSERIFYLSEFLRFFQKRKKQIFRAGYYGFVLSFVLTLFFAKPHFLSQATFLQVKNHSVDASSLQSLLSIMKSAKEDDSAISVMESKALLTEVVREKGVQVEQVGRESARFLLFRELHLSKRKNPFLFENVTYNNETKQTFFIRPLSSETFEVLDKKKKKIADGKLFEPVVLDDATWTLVQMPSGKRCVAFHLHPLRAVLPEVQKNLQIKTSRRDGNLLVLKAKARERETAIGILNVLMEKFQKHLHQEHEELVAEQICYLQQRRDQLACDYEETLRKHVSYLKNSLGMEGFLGLAQEIAMLNEPKEKYSAQKHQIDLEIKKWKKPILLEAAADHPWKAGLTQQEALDWQTLQIIPADLSTEEFAGMDLSTIQKLHAQYSEECDHLSFQKVQLEDFQERIFDPEFEISPLSQVLTDPVSQSIIQKGVEISLQLADHLSWSEKERKRLDFVLATQKAFLHDHIGKKRELLIASSNQVEKKMACLQQKALELLQKEKANIEGKLSEIGAKMAELPEKWQLESQLKLKKELTMQILEGLTQLSESKVLDRHLFHIESKPLDCADAPLDIEPPHLFLFASMGGLLGAFLFATGSVFKSFFRGFPLSSEYLRDRKFQVGKKKKEVFERIGLALLPGETLALIGNEWSQELNAFLQSRGFKEQEITILQCAKGADTPEALHILGQCDRFLLQIQDEKIEDLVPFEGRWGICIVKE
jgi:capsular polysaccharide biosynthesis protein